MRHPSTPLRPAWCLCAALLWLAIGPAATPAVAAPVHFTVLLAPFETPDTAGKAHRAALKALLTANGFRVVEPPELLNGPGRYAGVSKWLEPAWRDGWLARTQAEYVLFGREDGDLLVLGIYPGYDYDDSPNELTAYRPGDPAEMDRLARDIGRAVINAARDFVDDEDMDNRAYRLSRHADRLKTALGLKDSPFFRSPGNTYALRLAVVETLMELDWEVEDRFVLEEVMTRLAPLLASEKDNPDTRGYVWSLSILLNTRLGDRYDDPAALLRAVADCDAVLAFPETGEDAETASWTYAQKGENLRRLAQLRDDNGLYRRSSDDFMRALDLLPKGPNRQRGDMHSDLGLNGMDMARATGDPRLFKDAIGHFDRAIENFDRREYPWSWGMAQVNRACALIGLADIEDQVDNRRRANKNLRLALEAFTLRDYPSRWLATEVALGRSLVSLGDETGTPEPYQEAAALLDKAVPRAEAEGLDWSEMSFWLGLAHEQLGETGDDAVQFETAATWYDKTLGKLPDDDLDLRPYTYKRLGYVLAQLGERESLPEYYDRSGQDYAVAAALFARSGDEEECALARFQEGRSYLSLTARTPQVESLDKALSAFTKALDHFRGHDERLATARCNIYIARCLLHLGDRLAEADHYVKALARLDEAQKDLADKAHPADWLNTVAVKGMAYARLADHYRSIDDYDKAIGAYSTVLTAIRLEDNPELWVDTQSDLGMTLKRKAAQLDDVSMAEEAGTHFQAALDHLNREQDPARWARVSNNYANLLCFQGRLTRKTGSLEQGIATYRAVQAVWTRERYPLQWAMTLYNIGNAQLSIASMGGDGKTAETALSLLLQARDNLGDQSPGFRDDIDDSIRTARNLIRRLQRKTPARSTT
ncbi:hypothetical protein DND132_1476 [Pseudodesulfovibrio mercurii]|uniref:Tetratricopeptide repeat protein n=1 Tax=Pseudodesulfovibrio mercurii TaxID=641491 RepID=F0JE75_9BACT|nr:hypothetical protein [Pseudodesulfovibrio mercurii]EGB14684.1 hypothetical protein DND132_1476 [Pseudodesulfovibrio mercurii]